MAETESPRDGGLEGGLEADRAPQRPAPQSPPTLEAPQAPQAPQAPPTLEAPQAPQAPPMPPPISAPGAYPPPPGVYAPPAGSPVALAILPPRLTAVEEAVAPEAPQAPQQEPRDRYTPDPKPRSPVWETVKWPLRKALLGIYLGIQVVRRHKLITLGVVALLVALIGAGGVVYQLTRPGPPPLSIERPGLPALPNSVLHYLHGRVSFNGQEIWDSLDPSARAQSGVTEPQIQAALNQDRSQGVRTTRMVYSGGYQAADGTSHFTIEVFANVSGQTQTTTLYIVVGSSGLITGISSL